MKVGSGDGKFAIVIKAAAAYARRERSWWWTVGKCQFRRDLQKSRLVTVQSLADAY